MKSMLSINPGAAQHYRFVYRLCTAGHIPRLENMPGFSLSPQKHP